jgi:rubredoxin
MTWSCPSCGVDIKHEPDNTPIHDHVYDCHLCGLQLVYDAKGSTMRVPSYDQDAVDLGGRTRKSGAGVRRPRRARKPFKES